jgi:hypothetical protein
MVAAFSFEPQNIGNGTFLPKLSKKSTKFIGRGTFFYRYKLRAAGGGVLG